MSTPPPNLIALDWGTTALRAYLLGAHGTIIERRAEPWGLMNLPDRDFAAAFDAVTHAWRAQWPGIAAIAAGMVGSAQGWLPVPYVAAPASADSLAAALAPVHGGALHIVPGVMRAGDRPDVMRGEETQIVGVLALRPDLARDAVLVLPGTHSKWVRVVDGRIADFSTFMTGELFAVLRDHSILGRPARDVSGSPDPGDAASAFARGVRAARDASAGIAPLLFSARALVLADRLTASASLEYLSGLLIGDELRTGLASGGRPAALVGDPALGARYASALSVLGIGDVLVIDGAAAAGLWSIASRAGLTAAA